MSSGGIDRFGRSDADAAAVPTTFARRAVLISTTSARGRASLGAPGALSLAVNLSPSDRARLVGIRSPDHADQVSVLVDGKPAVDGDEPPSMAPADALTTATLVPPGFHTVQVQLTEREVEWLQREEWAETADDILWRRTKLGLRIGAGGRAALDLALVVHA